MFLECDELAIKKDEWEAAKSGDEQVISKLLHKFDGMWLYEHALSIDDNDGEYIAITIRELNELRTGHKLTVRIKYEQSRSG